MTMKKRIISLALSGATIASMVGTGITASATKTTYPDAQYKPSISLANVSGNKITIRIKNYNKLRAFDGCGYKVKYYLKAKGVNDTTADALFLIPDINSPKAWIEGGNGVQYNKKYRLQIFTKAYNYCTKKYVNVKTSNQIIVTTGCPRRPYIYYDQQDYDQMCKVVMYATGYNNSKESMKAVTHVIMNRVLDNRFPDTAYKVVTQKTIKNDGSVLYQYVNPVKLDRWIQNHPVTATVKKAVKEALYEKDFTGGALYHSTGFPTWCRYTGYTDPAGLNYFKN